MTINDLFKACVNITDIKCFEIELSSFDYEECKVKFEKHVFCVTSSMDRDSIYTMITNLYGDKIVSYFHIRDNKSMIISAKKGD